MYVAQIMSHVIDTATTDMKLSHAAQLMRDNHRRFLPVVDEHYHLLGLFSYRELTEAEPSSITTLSVGEVNYLTSKITVGQLMQKNPLTCTPQTLVEEAGRIIRENKIGCLPVIENEQVVGVITETDILDFFLDITGSRLSDSARIAVHLADRKGELRKLLEKINDFGGYIATVVSPVSQDASGKRIAIVRYRSDNPANLDSHLRDLGYEIITEELPKAK